MNDYITAQEMFGALDKLDEFVRNEVRTLELLFLELLRAEERALYCHRVSKLAYSPRDALGLTLREGDE